jgi:type IV pilus assembly protein PilV
MVSAPALRRRQRGVSMIEVLVTIVILAVGLLGLAGLQSRLQMSEMEGYQRAQAMILLEDMAHRFAANRNSAADYVTANPLGAAMLCPADVANTVKRDVREWCLALQGAGEKVGAADVGAMIGGRGCIEALPNSEYLITVAWQGMGPVSAPPASVACGKDLYNSTEASGCISDRCRRVVTTVVKIAPLQ